MKRPHCDWDLEKAKIHEPSLRSFARHSGHLAMEWGTEMKCHTTFAAAVGTQELSGQEAEVSEGDNR